MRRSRATVLVSVAWLACLVGAPLRAHADSEPAPPATADYALGFSLSTPFVSAASLTFGIGNAVIASRGHRPSRAWAIGGWVTGGLTTAAGVTALALTAYADGDGWYGLGPVVGYAGATLGLLVGSFTLAMTWWGSTKPEADTTKKVALVPLLSIGAHGEHVWGVGLVFGGR